MTTDQTIDGVLVSRELLERFVSDVEAHNYGFEGLDEVRALLDAPAECRCKRYGKGNPHWPCPVHPVKPSAQHQGEPVAFEEWFRREIGGDPNDTNFKGLPTRDVYVARKAWNFRQPAPVAVVLPERNTIRTQNPIVMNGTELVQVWNACLDEVARLNKPTKKGD